MADLGARQGEFPFLGIAPALEPARRRSAPTALFGSVLPCAIPRVPGILGSSRQPRREAVSGNLWPCPTPLSEAE